MADENLLSESLEMPSDERVARPTISGSTWLRDDCPSISAGNICAPHPLRACPRPLYAAAIYIRLQPAAAVDVAFFDLKRPGAAGSGAIQPHPRERKSELRQLDERWRAAFRHCGDTAVDRRSTYKTLRPPVRLPLLLSPSCTGTQTLV